MARTRRRSRSTSNALVGTTLALSSVLATTARAQEQAEQLDPAIPAPATQWDFGLRGVTSVNAATSYGGSGNPVGTIDFSDTYAYARARTPLFSPSERAGALFALTFPDQYNEPGTLLVAEANALYESKWLTARLGRGRIRSQIIPLPSLRDDDFIRWSNVQNPFSDGRSTADHQFGNTADASFWASPRFFADVHIENLTNNVLAPANLASFQINSYGVTLGYSEIPSLARMAVVRKVGVGANVYRLDLPSQEVGVDALAGAWLNVVRDPVHGVDWRMQGIYNRGTPSLRIGTLNDTFRAEQISVASSIGYSYRREMMPTFRTNVIGAYKRYVRDGIDQMSVAFNAFYALGAATDVGLQYQVRSRPNTPEAFGDSFAHSIKLAFIVALDTTTSRIFDERDSLLNTESGYLP
jgi:hypothetical protein